MKMALATLAAFAALGAVQETKKDQLRTHLKDTAAGAPWIYDDVAAGFAEAQKSGKPMLVVFR